MSSLIIAAAGAGKTTFLVKKALEISENVLIKQKRFLLRILEKCG